MLRKIKVRNCVVDSDLLFLFFLVNGLHNLDKFGTIYKLFVIMKYKSK